MRKAFLLLVGLSLTFLAGCGGKTEGSEQQKVLLVAVAASLQPVVQQVAWTYQAEHKGVKINITSGSSGTLMRQAEQGANFDLFLPAGEQEMNELSDKNVIAQDTIKTFLGNTLVIAVPEESGIIKDLKQLNNPMYKHIGIAEPETVPAGRYARQTLEKANLWQILQPKFVYGNNVRSTLTYAATANADAAFVYKSDALSEEKVHIALEIDDSMHQPIRYPMAVFKNSKNPDLALDFMKALESPAAKNKFKQAGFKVD